MAGVVPASMTGRVPPGLVLVAGALGVCALGLADLVTGQDVTLTMLYALVVVLVTWTSTVRFGVVVAVLSAAVYFTTDLALARYAPSAIGVLAWNAGSRLFVLVTLALGLGAVRRYTAELAVARAELERAVTELERSNEELARFGHVVSHDLREPLRTIATFGELLDRRGALGEQDRAWVATMRGAARRAQALVDELLAFARVDREEQPPEPVDLAEVVAEATANLATAISESDARIEAHGLPTVPGRRALLVQAFQNLLANAIKYRSEAPPRVEVVAERGDEGWIVRVCDNGVGVPPDQAPHIFDMFRRARADRPGTGVGLSVVKRIVEHHGGRVWVQPNTPDGSVFSVLLPYEAVET